MNPFKILYGWTKKKKKNFRTYLGRKGSRKENMHDFSPHK